MKTHTTAGAAMLADSASPHLQMAATIALSHHERWDGNGYPHGLSGRAIPVEARIVMVADVFDALTHERPYKDAMDVPDAIALMRDQTGSFFDPWVMAGFEHLDHEQAAEGERATPQEYVARSSCLSTFPDALRGSSSTMTTLVGFL